jgi:AraC family transcriptional regulator of adaptative response/methylated-DNA-[protein]-cysteine methyltransferase
MNTDNGNSNVSMLRAGVDDRHPTNARETLRYAVGRSWIGAILAAFSNMGVVAILIGDDANVSFQDLQARFPNAQLVSAEQECAPYMARILAYIETPLSGFDLPLDPRGTDFQKRVWKALQDISGGELASYSDIAERVGIPGAAQAIASACAANNIAIAIPCHRVVLSDGRYGGYAWGVKRKQRLIEREIQRV